MGEWMKRDGWMDGGWLDEELFIWMAGWID